MIPVPYRFWKVVLALSSATFPLSRLLQTSHFTRCRFIVVDEASSIPHKQGGGFLSGNSSLNTTHFRRCPDPTGFLNSAPQYLHENIIQDHAMILDYKKLFSNDNFDNFDNLVTRPKIVSAIGYLGHSKDQTMIESPSQIETA